MTLKIEYIKKEAPKPTIVVNQRLCVSDDGKRLVPDGHPDAATLFCIPGREVDQAEFESYELDLGPEEPGLAEVASGTSEVTISPPESDGESEADAAEEPEAEPEEEKPKPKRRKRAKDKAVKGPDGDK